MAKSSTDVMGVTLDSLSRLNLTVHFSLNVCALRTFLVPVSALERTLDLRFTLLLFHCLASGKHQFAMQKNNQAEKKTGVIGIPASADDRVEFSRLNR